MACLPTETRGELEFVQALHDREAGRCRGPLLRLGFWPYRIFVLEHILDSQEASDILWDGFREDGCVGVHFELCGAHWLDLATLCAVRSRQYRRKDWVGEAEILMREICQSAQWDVREMANMFAWQRQRLT